MINSRSESRFGGTKFGPTLVIVERSRCAARSLNSEEIKIIPLRAIALARLLEEYLHEQCTAKRFETLYRKSEQGLLHVRQAKGDKDRYVILPEVTLTALRDYWRCHRNPTWLFPSGKTPENQYTAETHMDRGGTQRSFKAIITSVGINKDVSIHTLRHC